MKIHGIRVDFDPRCRTITQARGLWPFYRIVVGREWFSLEGEARAAQVLHEVAHCRMHHALKRFAALPLVILWYIGERCGQVACSLTQQQELAADRYAADHGFALDLARSLERFPAPESPFYPSHETRIAILRARHPKEASPC